MGYSISLETERLLIRDFRMEDAEAMLAMHSDPEVQKYTGEPVVTSIEEMKERIQDRLKAYKELGYGRWTLIEKATGTVIGWAGLLYLPEFDQIDLGYRLRQEFWGKGYATESSHVILKYGFEELGMEEIIAIAYEANVGSIKVMQKVGMKFYKKAIYDENDTEEAIWYRLTQDQYRAMQSN